MKPLNYDNSPCSPTSSNCVIWQGPDLHIIKLCKGDTISDVIASLATELAIVMEQLSITNYDLSCFDLVGCKPETYQELLQFLIEQICLLQGLSSTGVDTTGKSDDVLITVAPCFIVNGVTVMTLIDYVTAIGLKICDIIDQIAIINNTLNELDIRVTILENTPPPTFTLPTVASDCILQNSPQIGGLGSPAVPMDQLLSILINDNDYGYCALLDATALPASLIDAVLSQCILNTDIQLSTGTTYSANPNWNSYWQTTENNLAASLSNVWVVLCDIYNYLDNQIGLTITETDCALGISNDADVYGYIDITSGPYAGTGATAAQNKQIVCSALYQWWVNYSAANPSYTGNIYIYESGTETYLSHPNKIKLGTNFQTFLNPLDGTTIGAVTPPGYAPGWAGPTAMLFVAFVNETNNPDYHGGVSPPSLFSPAQPTSTYTSDFNTFTTDYTTYWTSFNAVVYPAYAGTALEQNFLLHAYAATNNTNITLSGLSGALGANYTIPTFGSVTPTGAGSNPYITANQGLWNYGWGSILDKAVDSGTGLLTFTTVEFENDLNSVLSGGSANCSSESLIESWDPITQSLVLRQITSCSLDLSVTSEGCLSIEAPAGSSSVVEAGTNVNITSNTVGTTTTYTVNSDPNLETFVANLYINTTYAPTSGIIPIKLPADVDGISDGQTIKEYTQVSSNSQSVIAAAGTFVPNLSLPTITFGSFSNTTGIFTITDPGTYLIKATIHLKPDNGSSVFWSGPSATFSNPPTATQLTTAFSAIGSFYIGITPDDLTDVYVADSQTLTPGNDRCVEISTSKVIATAAPIALKVKVLNTTNRAYNGTVYTYSDTMSFSIIKLRNDLTITQL
jgi:hypothetical protein